MLVSMKVVHRSKSSVFLKHSPPYFLRLNLELIDLATLASQETPGILLSQLPHCWAYRHTLLCPVFTWGLNSSPIALLSKPLTH